MVEEDEGVEAELARHHRQVLVLHERVAELAERALGRARQQREQVGADEQLEHLVVSKENIPYHLCVILVLVDVSFPFSFIYIYVPTKHGICTIMEFFPPII